MSQLSDGESCWTHEELELLKSFRSPIDIQNFINSIPYNDQENCKSPRYVFRERTAHCAEGAYLAAAILKYLGFPPLIVDLQAENDDDHLITVFQYHGYWGAIAKSNTTLLRYREPVYRDIRELVMSYFEFYFNTKGDKSLKSYSEPFDMQHFDASNWITTAEDLNWIGDHFYTIPHVSIAPPEILDFLSKADENVMEACFLGSNPKGLYKAT